MIPLGPIQTILTFAFARMVLVELAKRHPESVVDAMLSMSASRSNQPGDAE